MHSNPLFVCVCWKIHWWLQYVKQDLITRILWSMHALIRLLLHCTENLYGINFIHKSMLKCPWDANIKSNNYYYCLGLWSLSPPTHKWSVWDAWMDSITQLIHACPNNKCDISKMHSCTSSIPKECFNLHDNCHLFRKRRRRRKRSLEEQNSRNPT